MCTFRSAIKIELDSVMVADLNQLWNLIGAVARQDPRTTELMFMIDAAARAKELQTLIRKYDYHYYVLGAGKITDAEYDVLFKELQELEQRHPELADANSPTARIGGLGNSGFVKTRHLRRMLSLRNTYNSAEVLAAFAPGDEIVVEPKVDGLSLKLVYKKGRLVQAVTRGNGEYGDEVTENARTIRTVPLILEPPVDLEVTGEVYMTYSSFNQLNEELEAQVDELFANARNAAAGSLKLKDSKEVARRHLRFATHGCNTAFDGVTTYWDQLGVLEGLGFQTMLALPATESCATVTSLFEITNAEAIGKIIQEADVNRRFLDLATDGLVFKHNSLRKQEELGEGNKYPNWAVAFKYPPERKSTTLLSVTIQVGRTGKVTPVAELKPVLLGGTIVKRASLCNEAEIKRLGIQIGDEVFVEKSAEIIPKVMGVSSKVAEGFYAFEKRCPSCEQPLTQPAGLVDWFCLNKDCEERVFNRLRHATGKQALDIDGCGQAMIQELMKRGVRRLSQLLSLKDLSFLKPAARVRFAENREVARRQPFWRQLHALGIEGLGVDKCKMIAQMWPSLIAIFDELNLPKLKELIGPVTYENFTAYIGEEQEEISALEAAGLSFSDETSSLGPLTGKIFAITGALMTGSRDSIVRKIEAHGGMVKANMSKKVNYLVAGLDAGATKTNKAQAFGITTISEEQLYVMMGEPMPAVSTSVDPNQEY